MTEVVLLNASYEVLGVVPIRRAMTFIMRERVDVVAYQDGIIQSAGSSMQRPLVLLFREYIKVPGTHDRKVATWSRHLMLRRDNYTCAYCGKSANTVDHINPRSLGGRDEWMNTIAACLRCNNQKSNRTLEEYGVPLRFQPKVVYTETQVYISVAMREMLTEFAPDIIGVLAPA